MTPSRRLIEFLKAWEGPPHLSPRRDPVNPKVWDIGYGHVCNEDHPSVTQHWCEETLVGDVIVFGKDVDDEVTAVPAQHEYDACVSLAYNIGMDAFRKSTLLKKLNGMDFDGASAEFGRWVRSNGKVVRGLVRRREAERAIFDQADYSRRP